MDLGQILGALELGLIYGLVALGVYLTFRVIDFPDLSVDGTFPLGAAVAAVCILGGVHPVFATVLAFGAGMLAGFVTGYLNVRLGILGLLAGILTMTGLFSINLRIMGKPNLSLWGEASLFVEGSESVMLLGIIGLIAGLCVLFLHSEIGLAVRATGVNERVCRAQGIRVGRMKMLVLGLSNGLVALGGALFAQVEGFADVTMGTGTLIVGLASVIIGEAVVRSRKIVFLVVGAVIGSIVYRIAVGMALNAGDIGLKASDMKLLTAVLIAATMVLPRLKGKWSKRKA